MVKNTGRRYVTLSANVLMVLTLVACAGSTVAPQKDRSRTTAVPARGPAVVQPKPRVKPVEQVTAPVIRSQTLRPDMPPAAKAVQRKAMRQLSDGYIDAAIVSAERGLRIAKNSPELLWILARSYELKNEPKQAVAFARQGLRYSSGRESKKFEQILVRASQ